MRVPIKIEQKNFLGYIKYVYMPFHEIKKKYVIHCWKELLGGMLKVC